MYIKLCGDEWFIDKSPSVFVIRKGFYDCSIYKRSSWGRRQPDGKTYKCVMRVSVEKGEIIRQYGKVPDQFNNEWLRQNAFID